MITNHGPRSLVCTGSSPVPSSLAVDELALPLGIQVVFTAAQSLSSCLSRCGAVVVVVSQNPGRVFIVNQQVWWYAWVVGPAGPSICALLDTGLPDSVATMSPGAEGSVQQMQYKST
ncbi:hypothetical protein SprV_0702421200 [Sparganum proliferum]